MKRVVLACLLFAASLSAFAQTAVSIVPTGYDWVSKGVARTYTSTNSRITFTGDTGLVSVSISGNDGKWWTIDLKAPLNETLQPGEYFFAERYPFQKGRAPGLDYSGDGAGCNNVVGSFNIRQIQFTSTGQLHRLEATAIHYCESYNSAPVGIAIVYGAPALNFSIGAPDLNRAGRNYYGDTSTFSLVNVSPTVFQYKASGLRDVWTLNVTGPAGQAQLAKGTYLTEGFASGGAPGMNILLGAVRRAEYGKLEILSIGYRNGAIVQLSARFWFYSDAARTKVLRSGRLNFWK